MGGTIRRAIKGQQQHDQHAEPAGVVGQQIRTSLHHVHAARQRQRKGEGGQGAPPRGEPTDQQAEHRGRQQGGQKAEGGGVGREPAVDGSEQKMEAGRGGGGVVGQVGGGQRGREISDDAEVEAVLIKLGAGVGGPGEDDGGENGPHRGGGNQAAGEGQRGADGATGEEAVFDGDRRGGVGRGGRQGMGGGAGHGARG